MISIRNVGFVFGFILLLGWIGVLLNLINAPEERSSIAEFLKTSNKSVQYVSVFNCLGCIVWLYLLSKVKYENRHVFMLLSVIWLGLNLGVIILFSFHEVFSVETPDTLQNYRCNFPILLLVAVIYALLFVVSSSIFKSLAEHIQPSSLYAPDVVYPSQPPIPKSQRRNPYRPTTHKPQVKNLYRPRMNVNRPQQYRNHQPYIAGELGNDDFVYGHLMLDDNSDRWANDFIADSNSVISNDLEPHTDSHSYSHHDHSKHDTNDGQPSNSHHSYSHDTHCTPSDSSHHNTHTTSHDTYTSSHDTNTTCDNGTSGGDTGGCDSGGGNTGGGDD